MSKKNTRLNTEPVLLPSAYRDIRERAQSKEDKEKSSFHLSHKEAECPVPEEDAIALFTWMVATHNNITNSTILPVMQNNRSVFAKLHEANLSILPCNEVEKGKVSFVVAHIVPTKIEKHKFRPGIEEAGSINFQLFPEPTVKHHNKFEDFVKAFKESQDSNYFLMRRDRYQKLQVGFISLSGNGQYWHTCPIGEIRMFWPTIDGDLECSAATTVYKHEYSFSHEYDDCQDTNCIDLTTN